MVEMTANCTVTGIVKTIHVKSQMV